MRKKRAIVLLFVINLIYRVIIYDKDFDAVESKLEISMIILLLVIYVILKYRKDVSKSKPIFNVVIMDKQIKSYIKEARNNKDDLDKLYRKIVYKPVFKEITANSEYSFLANYYIKKTITKLDELENEINILMEGSISNIINEIINHCNQLLPSKDTTIYIFPCDPEDDHIKYRMGGVMGLTLGSGKILLLINPTSKSWNTFLPYVIAHEYHHSLWTYTKYRTTWMTLLENLIFEGRADSFANILYPDVEVPWTHSISAIVEKKVWDETKFNLYNTNDDYCNKIMFGDNKRFPLWGGYAIGYNIMQVFIKNNPDVSVEEWTNMDAKEILEKSGYEESLEKRLEDYNN